MPNALIVYITGANNSSALKTRLESKGYHVHRVQMNEKTRAVGWYADNGPRPVGKFLGAKTYDKVYVLGHHAVHPDIPEVRGVASANGFLSSSAIIDTLVHFGLKEPSKFVLIICNAASGSIPGKVTENDIGYSTGHNFASRLGAIDWFNVEVYAYNGKIGILDERSNELMQQLAAIKSIQPKQILPIGARYLGDNPAASPDRPQSVQGSKMRFYFQSKVLCCSAMY